MILSYEATAKADSTFTPLAGKYNSTTMRQTISFEVTAPNLVEATTKAQEILEAFDEDFSLVEVSELVTEDVEGEQ